MHQLRTEETFDDFSSLFSKNSFVYEKSFSLCSALQYYDYANPRLYTQFALLDTPLAALRGQLGQPNQPQQYRNPSYVLQNYNGYNPSNGYNPNNG